MLLPKMSPVRRCHPSSSGLVSSPSFLLALSSQKSKLQSFIASTFPTNIDGVNEAVSEFTNILICAAEMSLLGKKGRSLPKYIPSNGRHLFREMKSLSRRVSTDPTNNCVRQVYYRTRKCLKKLAKKVERDFKNRILTSLSTLQNENPTEYWNLVHECYPHMF